MEENMPDGNSLKMYEYLAKVSISYPKSAVCF